MKRKNNSCWPLDRLKHLPIWKSEIVNSVPLSDDPLVSVSAENACLALDSACPHRFSDETFVRHSLEIQCLAGWKQHKQIFSFTGELFDDLQTDEDVKIPAVILHSLPDKNVFVEVPDRDFRFFAFWSPNVFGYEGYELWLARVQKEKLNYSCICVEPEKTVAECIERSNAETQAHTAEKVKALSAEELNFSKTAIQLLLYLCSEKPDINQKSGGKKPVKHASSKMPASKREKFSDVVSHDVGIRYRAWKKSAGSVQGISTGSGSQKIPHIRRGHWHGFWTGKKSSENRKLVIRWVSPIFVNSELAEKENADVTVNIVKRAE